MWSGLAGETKGLQGKIKELDRSMNIHTVCAESHLHFISWEARIDTFKVNWSWPAALLVFYWTAIKVADIKERFRNRWVRGWYIFISSVSMTSETKNQESLKPLHLFCWYLPTYTSSFAGITLLLLTLWVNRVDYMPSSHSIPSILLCHTDNLHVFTASMNLPWAIPLFLPLPLWVSLHTTG